MIKQNQKLINNTIVFIDAVVMVLSFLLTWYIRIHSGIMDIEGGLLMVSQFTIAADTKKGLRPSFTSAAAPALGLSLFDAAVAYAKMQMKHVETGEFGADMQVSLVNDGPVTFMLES